MHTDQVMTWTRNISILYTVYPADLCFYTVYIYMYMYNGNLYHY